MVRTGRDHPASLHQGLTRPVYDKQSESVVQDDFFDRDLLAVAALSTGSTGRAGGGYRRRAAWSRWCGLSAWSRGKERDPEEGERQTEPSVPW